MRSVSELKVICDDCLSNLGISNIGMPGPQALTLLGPQMRGPLGPTYVCHCGRFYSVVMGYFSFVEGEGLKRLRANPKCHGRDCMEDPMYIKASENARDGYVCMPEVRR
jgi:hypothetical protein